MSLRQKETEGGDIQTSWRVECNPHTSAQGCGPAGGITSGDFWHPSFSSLRAGTDRGGRSVKSC